MKLKKPKHYLVMNKEAVMVSRRAEWCLSVRLIITEAFLFCSSVQSFEILHHLQDLTQKSTSCDMARTRSGTSQARPMWSRCGWWESPMTDEFWISILGSSRRRECYIHKHGGLATAPTLLHLLHTITLMTAQRQAQRWHVSLSIMQRMFAMALQDWVCTRSEGKQVQRELHPNY